MQPSMMFITKISDARPIYREVTLGSDWIRNGRRRQTTIWLTELTSPIDGETMYPVLIEGECVDRTRSSSSRSIALVAGLYRSMTFETEYQRLSTTAWVILPTLDLPIPTTDAAFRSEAWGRSLSTFTITPPKPSSATECVGSPRA